MDFAIALTERLQANRDLLAAGLRELGFDVLPSEGTYFLTAGIAGLTNEKDRAFCERLVREAGVALIPLQRILLRSGAARYLCALCLLQAARGDRGSAGAAQKRISKHG